MAKKAVLLFLWVFPALWGSAQSHEDFIFLKNGSLLYGQILSETDDSLYMETMDGKVVQFHLDEIGRISRSTVESKKRERVFKVGEFQPGFGIQLEGGYAVGVGEYDLNRVRANLVPGYQFNRAAFVGLGLGWRGYDEDLDNLAVIFADFRLNVFPGKASPYFGLGFGPAYDVKEDWDFVGMMFDPELGVTIALGAGVNLHFGVGVEFQRAVLLETPSAAAPLWMANFRGTDEELRTSPAVFFQLAISYL